MITAFTSYDLSHAIETLVGVSLMIALILVVRRPVARQFGAGVAYALWIIPALRLILPPLPAPMSIMNMFRTAPETTEWVPAKSAWDATPSPDVAPVVDTVTVPAVTSAPDSTRIIVRSEFVVPAPSAPPPAGAEDPSLFSTLASSVDTYLLATLFAIWVGGTLYMLTRSFWAHHSFMMTVRREAESASPQLQQIAETLSRQLNMKQKPFIASSLISSGPLVTGLFRPIVLLPAWFEDDYDTDQQRAALAHELTHIKRGDIWALQAAEIFVACLWFNPLAYLARRAFRTDQEAACDSDVLKSGAASPHAYGRTLLKAVQISLPERMTAAASLPLTHALKERMQRMTVPAPSRKRRLLGAAAAIAMGSAALIGTSSVTATAEELDGAAKEGVTIIDNSLYIDGKVVKDRQVLVLGDPMDNIRHAPNIQKQIDKLVAKIERETEKLTELSLQQEEMFNPDTFDFIVPLVEDGTAEFLGSLFSVNEDKEAVFFLDRELMTPPVGDPDAMKAWEDEIEARAEAWGEQLGERAEAWGERWEASLENRLEEMESRAEAWSEKYEMRMELHQDRIEDMAERIEELVDDNLFADFEARIEERHDTLRELAEACRDASLATAQSRVMSRETKDGHMLKIVCVAGGPDALRSATTLESIRTNDALCDADKKTLEDMSSDSFPFTQDQ